MMASEQKTYTAMPMTTTTTQTTMLSTQPTVHLSDPLAQPVGVQQVGGDLSYKYDVLKQAMPGVSIFLQPIAAPSALGFAAFFSACWCVGTWYCDWYGSNSTPLIIGPFVLMMGLAQVCAALWCYPARDVTGTVFHGTWGSLFTSWGVVYIMIAQKFLIPNVAKYGESDEFAMWLVTCAAITGCLCLVTLQRDAVISGVCFMQFIGTVLIFAGMFNEDGASDSSARRLMKSGGYFWMFAALLGLFRTAIYCLPQLRQDEYTDLISTKAFRGAVRVAVPIGEPGVRKGQ